MTPDVQRDVQVHPFYIQTQGSLRPYLKPPAVSPYVYGGSRRLTLHTAPFSSFPCGSPDIKPCTFSSFFPPSHGGSSHLKHSSSLLPLLSPQQ